MADLAPDFDNNAHILVDGVVSVGTTATALRIGGSLDASTEYIVIENLGTESVTLGGPGITFGNGLTLRRRQKAIQKCIKGYPIFAVVDTGTVNVYVMEKGC